MAKNNEKWQFVAIKFFAICHFFFFKFKILQYRTVVHNSPTIIKFTENVL